LWWHSPGAVFGMLAASRQPDGEMKDPPGVVKQLSPTDPGK
jgi:hypothetical protein